MGDRKYTIDVAGVEPLTSAVEHVTKRTVDSTFGFLETVCKPAAVELGYLISDYTRAYRLKNAINIIERSKGKLHFVDNKLQIHPKIALGIIEDGSLSDDDFMLELWAGLFAASCSPDKLSDENVIFISILKTLTSSQVKIIKYICENSLKIVYDNEFLQAEKFEVEVSKLKEIGNYLELHVLDRELDHLTSLKLIGTSTGGGININKKTADVTPKALLLNLFARCQGHNGDPQYFWKENIQHKSSEDIKVVKFLAIE